MLFAGRSVDQDRAYVGKVFFSSLVLILVLAGMSMIVGAMTWARGFVLGGAASLVNFLLAASAVRAQVWGSSGNGVRFGAVAAYAARMGTTAAALVFAALDDRIFFWAVLPGLFAAQLVLVAQGLTDCREKRG